MDHFDHLEIIFSCCFQKKDFAEICQIEFKPISPFFGYPVGSFVMGYDRASFSNQKTSV